MREPSGAEVVADLRGLVAVVTQHHAEEERPGAHGEVGRPGLERVPKAVGGAAGERARLPRHDLVDGEPPDDALRLQPRAASGQRRRRTADVHVLAGEAGRELRPGGAVGGGLQPAAVELDHDAHATGVELLRVAHQHGPAVDRASRDGIEPGDGAVGHAGGHHGDAHQHQGGPAKTQPRQAQHRTHHDPRTTTDPGPHDGGQRHRHHRPVDEGEAR